MKVVWERTKSFLKSEDGPTATEYAVMLALIIVASIGLIGTLGDRVSETFTTINAGLEGEGLSDGG
ncbi:MAG: Flp family type IVb pilin [Phycisphaerae bacterium]